MDVAARDGARAVVGACFAVLLAADLLSLGYVMHTFCETTCTHTPNTPLARRRTQTSILFSIVAVTGIVFATVGCVAFADDYGDYRDWTVARMRVVSQGTNAHGCCDTVDCACEDSGAPACEWMTAGLQEGACTVDSYCCEYHDYHCNCRSTSKSSAVRCDTCSVCIRRINNATCTSVCGTCSTPTVELLYGNNYTSIQTTSCGRDDQSCVDDFDTEFAPDDDGTVQGWYRASATATVTLTEPTLAQPAFISTLFFGVCMACAVVVEVALQIKFVVVAGGGCF
jgi:hypothetical protein